MGLSTNRSSSPGMLLLLVAHTNRDALRELILTGLALVDDATHRVVFPKDAAVLVEVSCHTESTAVLDMLACDPDMQGHVVRNASTPGDTLRSVVTDLSGKDDWTSTLTVACHANAHPHTLSHIASMVQALHGRRYRRTRRASLLRRGLLRTPPIVGRCSSKPRTPRTLFLPQATTV